MGRANFHLQEGEGAPALALEAVINLWVLSGNAGLLRRACGGMWEIGLPFPSHAVGAAAGLIRFARQSAQSIRERTRASVVCPENRTFGAWLR